MSMICIMTIHVQFSAVFSAARLVGGNTSVQSAMSGLERVDAQGAGTWIKARQGKSMFTGDDGC